MSLYIWYAGNRAMAYTIIVILASNMLKFIPFTGMQKEDHLTIAIWISCFQSVFAWLYFHFHLREPTCHFEIWDLDFWKKSNCSSRYSGLLNRACWCFPDTSDRRKSWHGCRDRATDLFRDSFTLSHGPESAEALGFPLLQFCISNISSTVPFGPRCCG